MRILPFPGTEDFGLPEDAWVSELEAALDGEIDGPEAREWREQRGDVRALAPDIAPEFERRMECELLTSPPPRRTGAVRARARALASWPGAHRVATAGAFTGMVLAVLITSAAFLSQSSGPHMTPAPLTSRGAATERTDAHGGVATTGAPGNTTSRSFTPKVFAPAASAPAKAALSAPGTPEAPAAPATSRRQQHSAAISLSAGPSAVQSVSDAVSRLAERAGGFVASSHVQVQRLGTSEATLTLSLPSAHLSAALAAIGRLAPVLQESQSLQDITGSYEAARRRLSDTIAEHRALLRALAKAGSEGEIAALRERLAESARAITAAQGAVHRITGQASSSEVEVTVLASARPASSGLDVSRGLHDAAHVLLVGLVALLIGLAALVPIAILLVALIGGGRLWRRVARERALVER